MIVRVAVTLEPDLAVMVAFVELVTLLVVNLNLAEVDPAGMTTDAETMTLELSLERVNVTPPVGAALGNVRVPVAVDPPATEAGEIVMVNGFGSFIRD